MNNELSLDFIMMTETIAAMFERQTPVRVIFNDPATIVFWKNGDKTVVKVQNGEPFDKEKGLAMAFVKHFFADKGKYNEIFKKFCGDD